MSGDAAVDRHTVGLVAGLSLLSTAAAAYEIAPASVIPLVRTSLGVGATGASALVSVMYATSVLGSIPMGVALDRLRVDRALVAAGVALLVAGAWGWWAATGGAYGLLLGSRVLGGLCYVVIWNAGAAIAGGSVPAEYRATAVGVFAASAPLGFALGQFGGPRIASAFGWPAVLPAFAAIAVLGVLVFLAATRGRPLAVDADSPSRAAFGRLFRNRAAWTLSALCFLAFALYLFLNSWLPSYLTEALSVPLTLAGLLTALFPAMGVLSRTGGGLLSDRLFDGRRRPVVVGSFAVALPAVAGFLLTTQVAAVVGLVLVAGFTVQLTLGLLFSYVTEVVAPEVRTTAVAMVTSVGMLGAVVAPIAGGALIDRAGYDTAFLVAAALAAVGVVLALRAPESGGS